MKKERNDFKAGLFIVISALLILAIVIGIKGVGRMLEPAQHPKVAFRLTDDIGGLGIGDDVRVGGYRVGVVRDIDLIQGNGVEPHIEITFSIPRKFDIRKDAKISVQGTLTGVSWLNFENLGAGAPLAAGDALVGRPSAMSSLFAAAGELGPELSGTIKDVRNVTLPKVNTTIDTFRGTGMHTTALVKLLRSKIDPVLERYYALADRGKEALAQIRDVFGESKNDFKGTVANLNSVTGTFKEKVPGILEKADGLLANIHSAVDKTNTALEDVKGIASNGKDVSASVRSILLSNRGKIDAMLASLKDTGDNLKFGTAEIRRSPWRLLYKPSAGEMANLNLYDAARQFSDGAGDLSDAAIALRDALKSGTAGEEQIKKLVEKLDKSFTNFNTVEQDLWKKVRE